MLQEANLAWLLHRAAKQDAQATTVGMVIEWASKNGADSAWFNRNG
ncbi:hypothetical protein P4S72_14990 [Vibrio sp. PP-XX7]